MALYEHVVLSRSELSQQQVEDLAGNIGEIVKQNGGQVEKTEFWGVRTLAYPIKKHRKAHYFLLGLELPPSAVAELERLLRINEDVLRFLTVRVEAIDPDPSPILSRRERVERVERHSGQGTGDADSRDDHR